METITLKVEKRSDAGKKASAALRRDGKIPAVIYGLAESQKLAVNAKELNKALSGPSGTHVILQLELGDGKGLHNALLKELQYHPITDKFIHADLLEIDLNKLIHVKLPLVFSGEPVGVKVGGGEVRVHARDLHIECMPSAMPRDIKVDITSLELNKVWHVSDLPLPEGIKVTDAAGLPVVSCVSPKKEEVAAPAAEAAAAPAAAPAAAAAPAGKEGGKK